MFTRWERNKRGIKWLKQSENKNEEPCYYIYLICLHRIERRKILSLMDKIRKFSLIWGNKIIENE